MQIGVIGLGRMGGNIVRRLMQHGHEAVVYDRDADAVGVIVHDGIEYGLMAAYAEGLGVLRQANIGRQSPDLDAETTPLRDPEHYQYDLNLGDVTEVWRRGSVISSWLFISRA